LPHAQSHSVYTAYEFSTLNCYETACHYSHCMVPAVLVLETETLCAISTDSCQYKNYVTILATIHLKQIHSNSSICIFARNC